MSCTVCRVSILLLASQLTKLHQLAMQQSPFPIAHSNQGFQGRWAVTAFDSSSCILLLDGAFFATLQLGWTPLHKLARMNSPFPTT